MPSVTLRSQRKCSNMSVCNTRETSETCDESIACKFMPVSETSMLPSVTRSLMASMTFLSVDAFWSVASNMVVGLREFERECVGGARRRRRWRRVGWRRDGGWPASDSASRSRAASLQRVSTRLGPPCPIAGGRARGRFSCARGIICCGDRLGELGGLGMQR